MAVTSFPYCCHFQITSVGTTTIYRDILMQKCYHSSSVINNASITVVTLTKTICPTEDRMSDIKSAHVGHHVCKGGILTEFLKITCADG